VYKGQPPAAPSSWCWSLCAAASGRACARPSRAGTV